jgi:DnaJ-class molecular chaperone
MSFQNVPAAPFSKAGTRADGQPRTEQEPTAPASHGTDPSGRSASRPEGEPCPHCTNGTFTRRTGPLSWQVQQMRCAFCNGSGRINPEGDA